MCWLYEFKSNVTTTFIIDLSAVIGILYNIKSTIESNTIICKWRNIFTDVFPATKWNKTRNRTTIQSTYNEFTENEFKSFISIEISSFEYTRTTRSNQPTTRLAKVTKSNSSSFFSSSFVFCLVIYCHHLILL